MCGILYTILYLTNTKYLTSDRPLLQTVNNIQQSCNLNVDRYVVSFNLIGNHILFSIWLCFFLTKRLLQQAIETNSLAHILTSMMQHITQLYRCIVFI